MTTDVSKSEEVKRGINRLLFWKSSNLPVSFDSFSQLNAIGKLRLTCHLDDVKTVDPVIRVFLESLFCVQNRHCYASEICALVNIGDYIP